MKVTIKTELKRMEKELKKNSVAASKALKATAKDLRSRIPGRVADEVVKVYGIKKGEIMPAKGDKAAKKAGRIAVKGEVVDTVQIIYKGRVLTPVRFGMTPKTLKKAPPRKPGQRARKRARPTIKAAIKKGTKKVLHSGAFLGRTKAKSEDKVQFIPFVREGSKRYPIKAIKTLSLPQMVSNEGIEKRINEHVNDIALSRLQHHLKRFNK